VRLDLLFVNQLVHRVVFTAILFGDQLFVMYSYSYGMRDLVLLICFKSSIVLCIGSYSCLLFRICIAYADWGLLFFMYRMYSW
jgi:hypothetical protein